MHEWTPKGMCSGSRDCFKFREIREILSRKRFKIETWLQWKSNRKSYVAFRVPFVSPVKTGKAIEMPFAG